MKRQNGITLERAFFVVVGMALFWQILRFRSVTEMLPYGSAGLPCFVTALAVVAALAALLPVRFERVAVSLPAVGLCAVAAAGSLALLWAASSAGWWDVDSAIACALAVLAGASEAVLLFAWYTHLARIGSTDDWPIMAMLFGSAVFSLFIAVVLFSLSPVAALFPVVVPLLAALCLGACSVRERGARSAVGFGGAKRSGSASDAAAGAVGGAIGGTISGAIIQEGVSVPEGLRARLLNFGAPPSGMLLALLAALSLLGNLVLAFSSGSAVTQEDYTLWLKYVISMALIAVAFLLLHRCENERKTSFAIGLVLAFALVGGMALLGTGGPGQNVGIAVVTSCKTCIEVLVLFLLVRDAFDCRVAYGNFLVLFVFPVVAAFLVGQCAVPAALGAPVPLGHGQVAGLSMLLSVFTLAVLAVGLAIIAIRSFNFEVTPDWAEAAMEATAGDGAGDAAGGEAAGGAGVIGLAAGRAGGLGPAAGGETAGLSAGAAATPDGAGNDGRVLSAGDPTCFASTGVTPPTGLLAVLSAGNSNRFARAGFGGGEGSECVQCGADGLNRSADAGFAQTGQEPSASRAAALSAGSAGSAGTAGSAGLAAARLAGRAADRSATEEPGLPEEVLGRIAVDHGLTVRETQILVYAFRGYSRQHIADLDVVSLNTVKSHWKNLYRKLDVHTRQELIDLVEARLIDGMPPSRP